MSPPIEVVTFLSAMDPSMPDPPANVVERLVFPGIPVQLLALSISPDGVRFSVCAPTLVHNTVTKTNKRPVETFICFICGMFLMTYFVIFRIGAEALSYIPCTVETGVTYASLIISRPGDRGAVHRKTLCIPGYGSHTSCQDSGSLPTRCACLLAMDTSSLLPVFLW